MRMSGYRLEEETSKGKEVKIEGLLSAQNHSVFVIGTAQKSASERFS